MPYQILTTMGYTEHEKLNTEQLNTIDSYVEFLQVKGYSICKLELQYYDGNIGYANHRKLRAEFFGADEDVLEEERQKMIKELTR